MSRRNGYLALRIMLALAIVLGCMVWAIGQVQVARDEKTKIAGPADLRTELAKAQLAELPAESYILHDAGILTYDPGQKDGETWLTEGLVPRLTRDGAEVWPVRLYEDAESRETVFLNADSLEIGRLPPEPGYDPLWVARRLLDRRALTETDVLLYDPSRVLLQAQLVLPDNKEAAMTSGGQISMLSGSDSDGDGLADDQEQTYGTDPENPDTDYDGMPDGWEVTYGYDPLSGVMGSLQGWWQFREGVGEEVIDLSGNANTAYILYTNHVSWATNAPIGAALHFTANTNGIPFGYNGGYVCVPSLSNAPTANGFSVAAWVRAESYPAYATVLTKASDHDAWTDGLALYHEDGGSLSFYAGDWNSGHAGSGAGITGVWFHVCGVYNGTNASIYVNGQLCGISTNCMGSVTNNDPLWIGSTFFQSAWLWDGEIADVRYYAAALSMGDISGLLQSQSDADSDGLTAVEEYRVGTDPANADTDGDGLSDGYEVDQGLNPLFSDSDGDGMPDGWEVANNLNPIVNDSNDDMDSDGLSNMTEYGLGTSPVNADTDGDGMPDDWEVAHSLNPVNYDYFEHSDSDGLYNGLEFTYGTDPWNGDTDGDGLSDYDEIYYHGTSPVNADTDGDGMSDAFEVVYYLNPFYNDSNDDMDSDGLSNIAEFSFGTSPNNTDTDGDGLSDYDEIYYYGTNPTNADSDGDGMSDGWEYYNGLSPSDPSDAWGDLDWDGVSNYVEWIYLSNPYSWDSDYDGLGDYDEVYYYGTSPSSSDTDGDGLSDYEEVYYYGTSPGSWDTDGDGLSDYEEIYYYGTSPGSWDTDGDGLGDGDEVFYIGTSPSTFDTDGDGMPDGWEYNHMGLLPTVADGDGDVDSDGLTNYGEYLCQTDPGNSDSDMDGLGDGAEVNVHLTNPNVSDTDGDGLGDWDEVVTYLTNPALPDTDGDGLSDGWEVWSGNTDPTRLDTDSDGLDDGWEVEQGVTNPLLYDTDGDGIPDGWDDTDADGVPDRVEAEELIDPSSADSDADGLLDPQELRLLTSQMPFVWMDDATATNLLSTGADVDEWSVPFALPFPVVLGSVAYTNAVIGLNGVVWLGNSGNAPDLSSANTSLVAGASGVLIAAYWKDLKAFAANVPEIRVADVSTNGARYCVIRYKNLSLATDPQTALDFELIVSGTATNRIYVSYLSDFDAAYGSDGTGATLGVTNAQTGAALEYAVNVSGSVSNGLSVAYWPGFPSDPLSADTDNDGLSDSEEVTHQTDLINPDSDGDGFLDGWEVAHGYDPLQVSGVEISGSVWLDTDTDGLWDAGEGILSGVTVFIDENTNNVQDAGEAAFVAGSGGDYSFTVTGAVTRIVRAVAPAGMAVLTPPSGYYAVVASNQCNFGVKTIKTLYVNASRPDDSGDGLSWPAAKKTIQAAVDAATVGDNVLVTNGVYNTGTRITPGGLFKNRLVITNTISVRSVGGASVTTIEGSGAAAFSTANAVRCAYMTQGVLDGFTLLNGAAVGHWTSTDERDKSGGCVNMLLASPGTEVRNCIIRGGKAYDGGGARGGWLVNCVIYGNWAYYGGAAYRSDLKNCTLSGNTGAADCGGAYICSMTNSISYGHSKNYAGGSIGYSCATPLPSGAGNIAVDPKFVNAASADYRLQTNSPCINAGRNLSVVSDKDILGFARIRGGTVDMGAYEMTRGYFVNASRPDDGGDGLSWSTAKKTIQAAVDLASAGDSVLVTNGVYNTGTRMTPGGLYQNRLVITNAVTVKSVGGAGVTVIEGSGEWTYDTANAVRCVYLSAGMLDGFTLQGGAAVSHYTSSDEKDKSGGCLSMFGATENTEVRNCIIRGGEAYDGGGAYRGRLINCVIHGNTAQYGGGAYRCDLRNCTLSGNAALSAGGAAFVCDLTNSIAYGNSTAWESENCHGGTLAHSCTVPFVDGAGNIEADPQFADAANADYRLLGFSPCIDAGSNAWVTLTTDLLGNARIQGGVVDMGAYEMSPTGDLDGDGMTDEWETSSGLNPVDPSDALGDMDHDGVTNKDEFTRGTDPSDPASRNLTWFVDSDDGLDTNDGLSSENQAGHGPKKTVQGALNGSVSCDVVELRGQAAFPDVILNPGTKSIVLRPIGSVRF